MNCERCQTELEDFLYGESSERLAAEMRGHLAGCAECASLRDELERENALFAQFYEQTAIDPAPETWDAIRTRIAAEPAREIQPAAESGLWQSLRALLTLPGSWLTPVVLRQAALALLLIALSVTATIMLMKRGGGVANVALGGRQTATTATPQPAAPSPTTPATNVAPQKPGESAPPADHTPAQPRGDQREAVKAKPLSDQELLARQLARAEREYQGAIKMLDHAIAKRRDEIQPEAFKQYQASLALIDSSIAQSKRALRERPDDSSASQFLLAAYAKKVDLMQTIAMN